MDTQEQESVPPLRAHFAGSHSEIHCAQHRVYYSGGRLHVVVALESTVLAVILALCLASEFSCWSQESRHRFWYTCVYGIARLLTLAIIQTGARMHCFGAVSECAATFPARSLRVAFREYGEGMQHPRKCLVHMPVSYSILINGGGGTAVPCRCRRHRTSRRSSTIATSLPCPSSSSTTWRG